MEKPETLPELMDRLRARFIATAQLDATQLRDYAGTVAAEEASGRDALRILVHRLAGSAGTFGFQQIGATAAALDELLEPARARLFDPADARARAEALALMLETLRDNFYLRLSVLVSAHVCCDARRAALSRSAAT